MQPPVSVREPIHTLYVTQEFAPYFAEGGLGLTARGLTRVLASDFGLPHTVILPYYPWLVARWHLSTTPVMALPPLRVAGRTVAPVVHRLSAPGLHVEVLLVRADEWYDRPEGIYRDAHYVEYEDAVERAVFFGRAVAHFVRATSKRFGLVHANDWQSGIAALLISLDGESVRGLRPRVLFNVHSGEYVGRFDPRGLDGLGLGRVGLDFVREVGGHDATLLLVGMASADAIATCSPAYADELVGRTRGTAMARIVESTGIRGIVSGVDPTTWDPDHPKAQHPRYTAASIASGKRESKLVLQSRLRLPEDEKAPVYFLCCRLVPEKGVELVLQAFKELAASSPAQLVVMGTGDPYFHDAFEQLGRETGAVAWTPFDQDLARIAYAGADFGLMPSFAEPCGLHQLISFRYGTLPIAHAVGGLKDTVVDLRDHADAGTGLFSRGLGDRELLAALEESESLLRTAPEQILAARRRAMAHDWTWRRTATEFAQLYRDLDAGAVASSLHPQGAE